MPETPLGRTEHYVAPLEEAALEQVDTVHVDAKPSNLWRDAWRDIRRRPLFYVSVLLVLAVVAMALFPAAFASASPTAGCLLANSNGGPAPGHPLGFTNQGCDIWARIVYGSRISISVGFITVALSTVLGLVAGAIAGYYGGWVDSVLSRIGDIFFSVPYILAAVVVMSVFSHARNIWAISLAIGGFSWAATARVLRSEILRVKNADYVMASKALGLSRFRTLTAHVLPNSIAPLIVVQTIALGSAIVAEATLSFLGVGIPNALSWGSDIAKAQTDIKLAPMALIYPSLALTLTVLAFISLGEVVRDALDPKARARR